VKVFRFEAVNVFKLEAVSVDIFIDKVLAVVSVPKLDAVGEVMLGKLNVVFESDIR
jgi:hypothetical protein